jgi:hypothetical protein
MIFSACSSTHRQPTNRYIAPGIGAGYFRKQAVTGAWNAADLEIPG